MFISSKGRRLRASNCCSGGRETPVGRGNGRGTAGIFCGFQALRVKQWRERYDRHRLEALERYAALIADGVRLGLNQESLARAYPPPAPVLETMTVLGRPAPCSLQLLMDLRIWSVHENLFLLRSQIPVQFPTKVKARTPPLTLT